MIQKKAMGSFNCSFMNMDVREKTLGTIFLVMVDFSMGMEPLFLFFRCIFRSERSLNSR
ncbi:hypothetical protein D3C81_694770 [compost metagenome]|jgi:hypothetical protein